MANVSINIEEIFLLKIGSTWLEDTLFIYAVIPLSLAGICLNTISFVVFMKREFGRMVINNYLRVFTLNSVALNLIGFFCFLTYTPRYFQDSYGYLSRIYRCKIVNYMLNTLYFYSNILDIVILSERLSKFIKNEKLNFFFTISPKKISISFLILCGLINLPFYFVYTIQDDRSFELARKNLTYLLKDFYYCGREPFFTRLNGMLLLMALIFVRDFITLIFEFLTSILTIVYFRKYLKNRSNRIHHVQTAFKKHSVSRTNNFDTNGGNLNLSFHSTPIQDKLNGLNRRLTKMGITLGFLSSFSHLATFLDTIAFLVIGNSIISFYFTLINFLLVGIKLIANFPCFYYLNTDFKRELNGMVERIFSIRLQINLRR